MGRLLGKGGYGAVHAGVRRSDGKKVALKFMRKPRDDTYITLPGDRRRLPLEVALMKLVCEPPHCPLVIELVEWHETTTHVILVLERPEPCIDLFDYCADKTMPESVARIITQQVIQAARHCSDRGVFHRDIKEENILLNPRTLEIKLIDFGCGDLLKNTPYTHYAGTKTFRPPEWIINREYEAEPATVWGLGVFLYQLLCREELFCEDKDIVDGHVDFPHHLSEADFFSRYIMGRLLGKGGYGAVHAGVRRSDGKKVALKFMRKPRDDTYITLPGDRRRLPLEVALMKLVCEPPHCPLVIELVEWHETTTHVILVLERPEPCIDLFDYCADKTMPESVARIITQQVIQAARHCSDRGVFHRDIKEENILLNPRTLEIKLIDFGCGDLLKNTPYTHYAGTKTFRPPEWIINREYEAEPATVWGLGVFLYQLLCREELFCEDKDIVDGHVDFPHHLSEAEFFSRYIMGRLLGKGGYGAVHAGVRRSDGKKVALKFMRKPRDDTYITIPGDRRRLPLEVALMKLVCEPPHCPLVIELVEWHETTTHVILVLERPEPCIDLFDYCADKTMPESVARIITQQVIQAARHCSDRGVFHRDIKEENILLNPRTLEIKLIDFGCGDLLKNTPYTHYAGTKTFRPPEWIINREYEAEPATVWGLGVFLYQLLCREELFCEDKDIVDGHVDFPHHLSE
ncbi:serine/threonine-protein kinase pim-2-like, partial [Clarias magur]